jgi:hypothetical protein
VLRPPFNLDLFHRCRLEALHVDDMDLEKNRVATAPASSSSATEDMDGPALPGAIVDLLKTLSYNTCNVLATCGNIGRSF